MFDSGGDCLGVLRETSDLLLRECEKAHDVDKRLQFRRIGDHHGGFTLEQEKEK